MIIMLNPGSFPHSHMRFIPVFLILALIPVFSSGQSDAYFRIKADFTVKEIYTDGRTGLTMGQVYFDKAKRKIVYNVRFPEKEIWYFNDSLMFTVKGTIVDKQQGVPGYIDFSIFSLSLNHQLKDYGLKKNTVFDLKEIVKEDDMVISIWKPKKQFNQMLGDVKVSVRGNKLLGVIIYNVDGQMIGKQIFSEYKKIGAIEFPAQIISYTFVNDTEQSKQLITYKNVILNQRDEDYFYNYIVPAN
jgi:hypothetical protein